jgi:hypothetical protein
MVSFMERTWKMMHLQMFSCLVVEVSSCCAAKKLRLKGPNGLPTSRRKLDIWEVITSPVDNNK